MPLATTVAGGSSSGETLSPLSQNLIAVRGLDGLAQQC